MSRGLARLVVGLRWLVVPAWAAAAVAAVIGLPGLGQGASLASLEPQHSEAVRTELRSAQLFGVPLITRVAVVQRDPDGLSLGAQERVIRRAGALDQQPDKNLNGLRGVLPLVNVGGVVPGSRERSTTAISYLYFDPEASLDKQTTTAQRFAQRYVNRPDDALVGVTGSSPGRVAQWQEISSALPWVTIATVALILIVVGVHFLALGAPLIALAAAGISYFVAVHLVGWLGKQAGLAVPREVEPVMVVLLLGIVTDYAIFFLAAARRRLAEGDDRLAAAQVSARLNIPIVFTAGLIVTLGTAALVVGRSDFFRAFGPGLAFTALVGMVVSITFIPATIALLGRATFWPRHPAVTTPAPARVATSGWRFRAAHFAAARPVAIVVVVLCVAVLGLAASGLVNLRLGFPVTGDLRGSTAPARAAAAATQGFAPGILSPAEVVVEGTGIGGRAAALGRLQQLLQNRTGVAAVIGAGHPLANLAQGAVIARNGNAARYVVVLDSDPLGSRALDVVGNLRRDLPGLLRQAGLSRASAAVAGDTALARETISLMIGDLWRIALAVVLVELIVLAVFLRSLRAPIYLVAASVLALAAALGITTVAFQNWFGVHDLAYFVPFTCAVLLAALGADYNVFVVGRVWQEARRRPMREAVAVAAPQAARAITIAGVTLAASFAMLAIVPLQSFRELAFAMAAGVLLETFLVRSLLVPALISLFRPGEEEPATDAPDASARRDRDVPALHPRA